MSEAMADIRLDAAIWMFARLEFLSPTERRPIMLTNAKEKIPMAKATSVSVKASWLLLRSVRGCAGNGRGRRAPKGSRIREDG
jgi:hypothetical protein